MRSAPRGTAHQQCEPPEFQRDSAAAGDSAPVWQSSPEAPMMLRLGTRPAIRRVPTARLAVRTAVRAFASQAKIMYTYTDEAPMLATYSLLPIIRKFTDPAGIQVDLSDISVAARAINQFPERLTAELKQRLERANKQVAGLQAGKQQKLELTALLRQVQEGDVKGRRPAKTKPEAQAEFDARRQLKGMTPEEALNRLESLVRRLASETVA